MIAPRTARTATRSRSGTHAERADGRALRQGRGLLARLRRLDAPLRRRAREPRRERRRRRRAAGDHGRRARVPAPRRAARRRRVLRRRRDEHRHLPRVAEPRAALERARRLRLREQPLGRVDARARSTCRSRIIAQRAVAFGMHVDQGRRPGRGGRLRAAREALEHARSGAGAGLPARRTPTGSSATTSATRRSTARRTSCRRRARRRIRSRSCASKLELSDEECRASSTARCRRSSRRRSSSRRPAPTRSPRTR